MNFIKNTVIATSISLALLAWSGSAAAVTDLQGKDIAIKSLVGKGRWTVFELWSSECHMCKKSIESTNQFHTANPQVKMYGIALDGPGREEAVQEFIDQHNIAYPTLISDAVEMDTFLYKTAHESFIGTPTLLVFDPKGELVAVQPGAVTPTELSNFIKDNDNSTDSKNAEADHAEKRG
jgi:thioredoxin-related protein